MHFRLIMGACSDVEPDVEPNRGALTPISVQPRVQRRSSLSTFPHVDLEGCSPSPAPLMSRSLDHDISGDDVTSVHLRRAAMVAAIATMSLMCLTMPSASAADGRASGASGTA